MNPGAIVHFRNRDWVLLPSEEQDVLLVRPLTGLEDDVVKIHNGLANLVGYELPFEHVESASFPLGSVSEARGAGTAGLQALPRMDHLSQRPVLHEKPENTVNCKNN